MENYKKFRIVKRYRSEHNKILSEKNFKFIYWVFRKRILCESEIEEDYGKFLYESLFYNLY